MNNSTHQWQHEELDNAYKSITTIIGGRHITAPDDYPPSEWRQYKQITTKLHDVRALISEIIKQL